MATTLNYFYAVMHCSPLQPKKLLTLLNKVIADLTANAVKFPSPTSTIVILQAEVTLFTNLIAAAKGGGLEATAARNKEAIKVHGLLQANIPYVNGIARGDKDTILLSGFDSSTEAQPTTIPDAPVIKKIIEGPVHGSLKIMLAKTTTGTHIRKVKRTLIVELTTNGTDPNSFKIVLITGSSKKLIILNMAKGVEVFIKIAAMNVKGTSQYSNTVSYIPQTGAAPSPTPTPGTGTTPPATA